MQTDHRRFVVGTDRDDRVYRVSGLLRDDGNEVVLAERDDPSEFAIDAVQEDADALLTTITSYADLEAFADLEDRLDEYGAEDVYVAVDDPHRIEGIEEHADAVYHQDDDLGSIARDLYRPFDWQYLDEVGETTYQALEDWREPRETDPEGLEAYLTEELGSRTGPARATKILNANPGLFQT